MSEEEFARLIENAVSTLRVEAEAAADSSWATSPHNRQADLLETWTIAASLPSADPADHRHVAAVPVRPISEFAPPSAREEWIEAPSFLVDYTGPGCGPASPSTYDLRTEAEATDVLPAGVDMDAAETMPLSVPLVRPPGEDETLAPAIDQGRLRGAVVGVILSGVVAAIGWHIATLPGACRAPDPQKLDITGRLAAEKLAARIVAAESSGDATAKNKRSSAFGAGQFLDGTWLDMIRAHRPDLNGRSEAEILELRRDPDLSREMVARFAEGNAAALASHCLPVTPGTLYLAHFAGAGGAVSVLSAPEYADAAETMAKGDSTGKMTREMIVAANPFLARFTVADLKDWADRKMTAAGNRVARN